MQCPQRRLGRGVYRRLGRSKTKGTRLDFDEARVGVEHGQRHLEPQEIALDPVEFEDDLASVVHLKIYVYVYRERRQAK